MCSVRQDEPGESARDIILYAFHTGQHDDDGEFNSQLSILLRPVIDGLALGNEQQDCSPESPCTLTQSETIHPAAHPTETVSTRSHSRESFGKLSLIGVMLIPVRERRARIQLLYSCSACARDEARYSILSLCYYSRNSMAFILGCDACQYR